MNNNKNIDYIFRVHAGKLRRYHKQSWVERFLDYKTNLLNTRDLLFVGIGFFESVYLLSRYRPNAILLKGGYVGLPIGFAASLLRIPFITHDSDAKASLTNSLVGRWGIYNMTGSNPIFYKYKGHKLIRVGVPVSDKYSFVDQKSRDNFRNILKVPVESKMIFITGGSLGANEINKAFVSIYKKILDRYRGIYIVHQVGSGKLNVYGDTDIDDHTRVSEFIDGMYQYSAAADIVITRASATSLAELAIQGKPIIVIPNPNLTGGHQLINSQEILNNNAGIIIQEAQLIKDPSTLFNAIISVLDNKNLSNELSDNISKLAVSDAAMQIAKVLLKL